MRPDAASRVNLDQSPPGPPWYNGASRRPAQEVTVDMKLSWQLALIALLTALVLVFVSRTSAPPTRDMAYSDLVAAIDAGTVERVTIEGLTLTATLPADASSPVPRQVRSPVPEGAMPSLLQRLETAGTTIVVRPAPSSGGSSLWLLVPWLIFMGLLFLMARRMTMPGGGGAAGGAYPWDKQWAQAEGSVPDVLFEDVAGQDSAKDEVAELITFLREPQRYLALGAEVPHGILLVGAPGTGKTLLARALAGEAAVPFYSVSASQFIEVFVGVGASRVRKLFEAARHDAPAIIFIDEIDSIGRIRGTGLGGGHDEREQTLNQILAEMDGFRGHEAVIVLAATNRPDVLDPALLRPGRFDRHVTLEMPDRAARRQILEVHTRHKPLVAEVDLEVIAGATAGFSGADLKNLANEAAMRAARERRRSIRMEDFEAVRDRVLLGSERTLALTPDQKHRLAVHEAGHATVAWAAPTADPLFKVSIVPHGRALGATQQLPEHESYVLDEARLRDRLAILLAGRTAERLLLGTVSSGAEDDLRNATQLAQSMASRWGMSPEVGPLSVPETEEHPFLGRQIAQPRSIGAHMADTVDAAVRHLMEAAEGQAESILTHHRAGLEALVTALEDAETLDRAAIEAHLNPTASVTPSPSS